MKQRKLSAASSRAELIASYPAGEHLAAEVPPAPPKETLAPEPDADAAVSKLIEEAIAAQEKDDDSDPNDQRVMAALQEAKKAQDADVKGEPAEEPEPPAKPKVAAAVATPPAEAEDEPACANPGCKHLSAAHEDGPDGKNTGPCTMENCECPAMQAGDLGKEDMAVVGMPGAEPAVPVAADAGTSQNAPPETEGGENMGPAFTAVLIIEGQPTGDGREIAPNALTWRTLPMPLMGLRTETHDPEGFDMNDPAVIAGRIDTIAREPGDGETQLIMCKGFFLANEDGMYWAELCEAMGRVGISGDVAVQASEVAVNEVDATGFPMDMSEVLTEGTIMGGTACPFPAFEGCYIVLGDGADAPEAKAIPQSAESPEVPDSPPAAVTAGGQLIHFMAYEECEPCDQGFDVITASGAGPTRPPKDWFSAPDFSEGDGRLVEILDRNGRAGSKFACPITVTENGQVFGHIAPWGICHKGIAGECVLAPHSAVDYAHFKRGQHITTAEGEKVRVGVLTADVGHASTRLSAGATMSHYDDTATAVADVNVGEDDYGIWVAGAIRSDASDEQIRKLTASSISGDWRALGGQLELVAALCVNEPGYALAQVASGHREALVAYGVNVMDRLKHPAQVSAEGDVALRRAVGPLLESARESARTRIAALG